MRLAVDIGIIPRRFASTSLSASVGISEERLYSSGLGNSVLLFGRAWEGAPQEYVAIASLSKIDRGPAGETLLHLSELERLRVPIDREAPEVAGQILYDVTDEEFSDVVARGNLDTGGLAEHAAPFAFASPPLATFGEVARQLATRYDGRCSFSGVPVSGGEGATVPIKPRDLGGELHVRHCLFLHQEPANLFNMFAWTVGPDHEIIVDCAQVGVEILSTVSPTGRLVLPGNREWWPDEALLAWHRSKFFDRLK